jgi:arylamine N-acetyltransferase
LLRPKKEIAMRYRIIALYLACLPAAVLAQSVHTIEVINDTRSRIDTFSVAPAGSNDWTDMDFRTPMQESTFDYAVAITLEYHDDSGCLRDLRTVLSDGRRIVAHNFDWCHFHAYRPGTRFRGRRPGSQIVP